jgi:hypothetical protein
VNSAALSAAYKYLGSFPKTSQALAKTGIAEGAP